MKIYDKNDIEILDIDVDDNSVRYRSIMNDDSLTLHFSTTSSVAIPRGAYVEFEGARYTLFYPENFKKHSTRNFEYTLILHGWREALKLYKYKDLSSKPYRLKFPLTATPAGFLELLVDCMNLHDAAGWSAGDCIVSDEKLVSFNHEYCFDVLNRIATEFNTEWEIAGKTIHLRKVEKFKDDPLPLSYGMGNGFKTGVGRSNDGDRQPIGLLYVQGGERNIDYSNYGSSSLLLPKSATLVYDGKTYRTDLDGMYITRDGNTNIAEDSFDGSSHYPKRVGTVSSVIVVDAGNHFYDIVDASIPANLNYRDCRIAGEKATIVFQSGALAGREFDLEQTDSDLTGYIHAERRFKIVPAELDGITMPGGVFVPKTGDKYAIFNISMPAAYISDNPTQTGASWDMFREAVRYFADEEKDKFSFVGDLDGVWSRSRWLEIGGKIVPGGHVLFSDPQFQPDGVLIRITAIKDYVNSPHKPEITLSNASVTGSFSADLGKIEAGEVVQETNKKEVMHFAKRQWRDAKETMEMIQNAMLDFGEGINPITINTMMMLVGDSSLQFYFKEDHRVTWNKSTKQLSVSAGTIMTIENERTITTSIAEGTYAGYFPAYISPALTEKSTAYYLYARFSISGSYFFLTTETYKSEPEYQSYYHLIGILNSEQADGDRSFVRLHGITEILPGRINTEKIVSTDGKTYFDLKNNIIRGNLKFLAGDTDVDLATWAGNTTQSISNARLYIQYSATGTGNWHDTFQSGDLYMRQKNGENGTWSSAIRIVGVPGADGHSPYIGANGNWWVWDSGQGKYVDSGDPARGEDGADGHSPYIGANGNWWVWDSGQGKYVDSGDPAHGDDGKSPYVGANGNWWVWNGTAWEDTGIKARGEDGADGHSPYIGANGNWWVWDSGQGKYVDSGDPAHGDDGKSPYVGANGNWWVWNGTAWEDTGIKARGEDGKDGDSVLFRYRRQEAKPAAPATGDLNPTGWMINIDEPENLPVYGLRILGGDWSLVSGEYRSKVISHNQSSFHKIGFFTAEDNAIVKINTRTSSEVNDRLYIGKIDEELAENNANALTNVSGTVSQVQTYTVAKAGFHFIEFRYVKNASTTSGTDAGFMSISIPAKKVWMTTCNVVNNVAGAWSDPVVIVDYGMTMAAYLTSAMQQSTDFFGGLVLSSVMGVRDITGAVRAYMSGDPALNDIAFAAGVQNFGTVNETQNIALRHGGSGKIGVFIVDESGRIVMIDPATGNDRLMFAIQNLPLVADLIATTDFGGESTAPAQTINAPSATLTTVSGAKDGSTITFVASSLMLVAESVYSSDPTVGTTFKIELVRNGAYYGTISTTFIQASGGTRYVSKEVNYKLTGAPNGNYSVRFVIERSVNTFSASADISTSKLRWEFKQQGVRHQQYGLDGMMLFYSNHHFHFTESKGLDVRGATNMPGVLLSATVNAGGGWLNVWGAKKSTIPAARNGPGDYTVYHSIGHTKYQVIVTTSDENRTWLVKNKTASSFNVVLRTVFTGQPATNSTFDVVAIGDNYAT